MSTGNESQPAAAAAAAASGAAPKKQPSLYARKLLQKLATLHPNASLESRQTIAAWMVFNRKKCEGMGEGLLSAMAAAAEEEKDAAAAVARLMLLLRVAHQVFLSDCPTVASPLAAGAEGDADKWAKSSQLRSRLGEIVMIPLFKALGTSFGKLGAEAKDQYEGEVRGMMEEWKEHNVFGGPTIWEEYKRGWIRAANEAAGVGETPGDEAVGSNAEPGDAAAEGKSVGTAEEATKTKPAEDDADEKPSARKNQSADSKESGQDDEPEETNAANISGGFEDKKPEAKDESAAAVVDMPASLAVEEGGEGKGTRASKRDSVASATVDVEVDFEGIEEARVEPARFLDACKNIATIQITRDLGSDAAMNLSSVLSNIPAEVEEACNTILTQQRNGEDETPITELLPTDSLSNLPDEVLDLDLKYARQSLQTYKEAIRQQRKARLQCLQLLMQSRCSFGSLDAARAFCGGEGSDVNMDDALQKLKKRKEILVDAMALEGLDVEEDEEEKKMEKEEESLKPLSWFSEAERAGAQPAAKKLKSS